MFPDEIPTVQPRGQDKNHLHILNIKKVLCHQCQFAREETQVYAVGGILYKYNNTVNCLQFNIQIKMHKLERISSCSILCSNLPIEKVLLKIIIFNQNQSHIEL